ncbi:MAG: RloB family protein [Magnetococcus sp. YQC-5]
MTKKPFVSFKFATERSCLSLERTHPRRPPRDSVLLFANEPVLIYLQELVNSLHLSGKVTCAPIPLQTAAGGGLERSLKVAPCRRLYLVLEWDGDASNTAPQVWQEFQNSLLRPDSVSPRLICCRPSFDLWLLLHFEDPSPEADDTAWLKERVQHLLATSAPDNGHLSLFARIAARLDTAQNRSLRMARERQLAGVSDDWFSDQPGTNLHELTAFLNKLASRIPDHSSSS